MQVLFGEADNNFYGLFGVVRVFVDSNLRLQILPQMGIATELELNQRLVPRSSGNLKIYRTSPVVDFRIKVVGRIEPGQSK